MSKYRILYIPENAYYLNQNLFVTVPTKVPGNDYFNGYCWSVTTTVFNLGCLLETYTDADFILDDVLSINRVVIDSLNNVIAPICREEFEIVEYKD